VAWLPPALQRHILHFEAMIADAVTAFAAEMPANGRVLDAGAGEGRYRRFFEHTRYTAVDLAIGDTAWDYQQLDAFADLTDLPFRDASFDAVINIVTLEHVREPGRVLYELHRVLKAGGRLLLVTPHEWEEHQQPHDYYRYTRYGLEYLLTRAGFNTIEIEPGGGFFRLLARRLWNSVQFFPTFLQLPAALLAAPPALLLPWLDGLDKNRNFTLGHLCLARK
jgi:SAM-dependent methyltransferase